MGKRYDIALAVLREGGYFRKALERHYVGGEKFAMRLKTATHTTVSGIGFATYFQLQDAGLLTHRECQSSSAYPEEYELRDVAQTPACQVELQVSDTWQTQARGTNSHEYDIYVTCAGSLGWPVKSFDEWMSS